MVLVGLTTGLLTAAAFLCTGAVADFGFAVFLAGCLGAATGLAWFVAGSGIETDLVAFGGASCASVTAGER